MKTDLFRQRALLALLRHMARWIRRMKRVPVRPQLTELECGAACLASILSYHGRKTTVAECRGHCEAGRDGVSAKRIAAAARGFGLRVRAYRIEPSALGQLPLPAIAHWQFNHFVVVEAWSAGKVRIMDPGSGRRRLTAAGFDEGFTGVVLTFEPGLPFRPGRPRETGYWRTYLRSMLSTPGARGVLAQILAASLLLQGLGLALPLFTKVLLDRVLPLGATNLLTLAGIGMALLTLTHLLIACLRGLLLGRLRAEVDVRMTRDFFEHMLSLPVAFFQQRTAGDLLMRLGSNSIIRDLLTSQVLSVCLDGFLVVIYFALIALISPMFGAVVAALGAARVLSSFWTGLRTRVLAEKELNAKTDEQAYLVEAVKGITVLKASGAEERAFDRWSALFSLCIGASLERANWATLIDAIQGGITSLAPILLLWIGASQVLAGRLSVGEMLALQSLSISCLAPLSALASSAQQLQIAGSYLERVADVMRAEPEQAPSGELLRPRLSGRLEVRQLSFSYAGGSAFALRDIDFAVRRGEKIGIVGPTGSGKSTLAMLLLGLYLPTRGEVLYDGVPLCRSDLRAVRAQIGVVLQEPFLYSGSIRQNISLGNPGLTLEEVARCARLAAVDDEISRMPMGYETPVSEAGASLSGGQRQRLALARAVASRPAVLLLDEATSHLDARTEAEIDRNLSRLRCTRIVIAHRLSTVRNADRILVLERGRIVEQGSHEELASLNARYAALARGQRVVV